jgi:ammonium transporter Rh
MIAVIGSIFLWMYWPSFNGALAGGNAQHRVIINTVLALTGSCVMSFLVSVLYHKGKFDMEIILNSTLAGGVIIGSSSDLTVAPVWCMVIGMLGGTISAIGYKHCSPFCWNKLKIHDTCGVHNLHGMPGVLGGIIGGITAAAADDSVFGNNISEIFEKRGAPDFRTAVQQGGYQVAALTITLTISIVGGLITGMIIRAKCFDGPVEDECFNDEVQFAECEIE